MRSRLPLDFQSCSHLGSSERLSGALTPSFFWRGRPNESGYGVSTEYRVAGHVPELRGRRQPDLLYPFAVRTGFCLSPTERVRYCNCRFCGRDSSVVTCRRRLLTSEILPLLSNRSIGTSLLHLADPLHSPAISSSSRLSRPSTCASASLAPSTPTRKRRTA